MPLSEHEQRLLEQIERALYADDPKFASAVRATDLKTHLLRRVRRSVALLVLGIVVLLLGVVLNQIAVGVAGFLLMLFAALRAATAVRRLGGKPDVSRLRPGRSEGKTKKRSSWVERVEERWKRRWEERDG